MELSFPKKEVERKERKERKGQYEALSREGHPSTVTEILSSGNYKARDYLGQLWLPKLVFALSDCSDS